MKSASGNHEKVLMFLKKEKEESDSGLIQFPSEAKKLGKFPGFILELKLYHHHLYYILCTLPPSMKELSAVRWDIPRLQAISQSGRVSLQYCKFMLKAHCTLNYRWATAAVLQVEL